MDQYLVLFLVLPYQGSKWAKSNTKKYLIITVEHYYSSHSPILIVWTLKCFPESSFILLPSVSLKHNLSPCGDIQPRTRKQEQQAINKLHCSCVYQQLDGSLQHHCYDNQIQRYYLQWRICTLYQIWAESSLQIYKKEQVVTFKKLKPILAFFRAWLQWIILNYEQIHI